MKPPIRPSQREEKNLPTPEELQDQIDEAVPDAIEVLSTLQNKADRDSTRVKAAMEILERSSIAPQRRTYDSGGSQGVVVQIGFKQIQNIKAALEDIEDYDTLKLLEGEDFEVEE